MGLMLGSALRKGFGLILAQVSERVHCCSDAGVVSPSEMKLPGTLGLRAGRVVGLIDGGLPSSHGSLFLGTCGGIRGDSFVLLRLSSPHG